MFVLHFNSILVREYSLDASQKRFVGLVLARRKLAHAPMRSIDRDGLFISKSLSWRGQDG